MAELTIRQDEVMTSREIADLYGKPHNDTLKKIRKLEKAYVQVFGGEGKFSQSSYLNAQNKEQPEILLNKSQALFVASRFDAVLHAKVQKRWEELESQNSTPALPSNYKEALEHLLIQVDKNEQLEAENTAKQEQLELQAPKVLFADSVSTSDSLILVRDMAKILKQNGVDIGGNRLFEWLRENGYLIKQYGTDRNRPTQRAINMGLFKVKETAVTHSSGNVVVNITPKITGKGQLYFINKFTKAISEA